MLFYGIAVVLVILFRPAGLLGYREFSARGMLRRVKNLGKRKREMQEE